MKTKIFILTFATLLLTGCQNNNLTAENEALKQQITELEYQLAELEQNNDDTNTNAEHNPAVETTSQIVENPTTNKNPQSTNSPDSPQTNQDTNNNDSSATTYTIEELTIMVDNFIASVGAVSPNPPNSENLDQFFTLKKEANLIDHALENYENSLETQYRSGALSREEFRTLDKEIEKLEETLDSAEDRLEITFGIDD